MFTPITLSPITHSSGIPDRSSDLSSRSANEAEEGVRVVRNVSVLAAPLYPIVSKNEIHSRNGREREEALRRRAHEAVLIPSISIQTSTRERVDHHTIARAQVSDMIVMEDELSDSFDRFWVSTEGNKRRRFC